MPKLSFLAVLAALGVISVAAAIVLNMTGGEPAPPERPPVSGAETAAQPETAPESAPETAAAPATPETNAAAAPPAFDVVRVGPDGAAVIAGRAAPGATVEIRSGEETLGEAAADARGEWVFVLETPLPPGEALLSLAMRAEGRDEAVLSKDNVLVIVPESAAEAAALALKIAPDGTTRLLTRPGGETETEAETETAAASGGAGSAKARVLTVETIDYNDDGRISISGRTEPGAVVMLYIDNKLAGNARADAEGFWRVTPETETAPGEHTVRADLTAADGGVAARVVMPFMREKIEAPMAPGDFITVQPGNSLWRIARRAYGAGFSYTVIYKANAGQITDPDLIYPGQIFKLPEAE